MTAETLIKSEEGLKLTPYRCSEDKLTIGYGYNMQANPLPDDIAAYLKANKSITGEMAERLFWKEFLLAKSAAMGIVGPGWTKLNEVRQAVCISMVYQLGSAGFKKFQQVIKNINSSRYPGAAYEMMQSKWEDQTEARCQRLAIMMATGEWLRV